VPVVAAGAVEAGVVSLEAGVASVDAGAFPESPDAGALSLPAEGVVAGAFAGGGVAVVVAGGLASGALYADAAPAMPEKKNSGNAVAASRAAAIAMRISLALLI
jgi:hypothetical protein